jgi:hypothetical protein
VSNNQSPTPRQIRKKIAFLSLGSYLAIGLGGLLYDYFHPNVMKWEYYVIILFSTILTSTVTVLVSRYKL